MSLTVIAAFLLLSPYNATDPGEVFAACQTAYSQKCDASYPTI